jgi:hypothetical protein
MCNDEKEGVTVIAAITATGEKLPLTLIRKGKTQRRLAGYHLPGDVWGLISESGWTTAAVMTQWMPCPRQEVYPTGPLLLIIGTYSAHRCEETKAVARELGIDLEFIPPGCTDRLQPCDRRFFGILKAKARKYWRWRHRCFGAVKTTHTDMLEILVKCWNEITTDALAHAWSISEYQGDPGATMKTTGVTKPTKSVILMAMKTK